MIVKSRNSFFIVEIEKKNSFVIIDKLFLKEAYLNFY